MAAGSRLFDQNLPPRRNEGTKRKRATRGIPVLTSPREKGTISLVMSTQEILVEEIKNQPEPVLRELLHYLKFLARQREEEAWADVLPAREVEQEVLDILDRK
jgi:hypothetical protein